VGQNYKIKKITIYNVELLSAMQYKKPKIQCYRQATLNVPFDKSNRYRLGGI